MASETEIPPQSASPTEVWPPDDTEESVVGTDLHQTTIMNVRWGINEVAQLSRASGGRVPWHALSHTVVLGFQRPNGTRYKTLPDVFVYRQPIGRRRGSVSIAVDGAPVLIVEVLSESTYATYEVDLDLERGKGYSYARAGVREYLTLDPTGEFLPELGKAWRLEDGAYRRWEPDADGRWHSAEIAAAFGMEGAMAAVYTSSGERQLREGEVAEELARKDAELDEMRRLLDEMRAREH